ncbi:hypothetical protein ACHHYP_04118 [Achlya hypogyna]|uniref:FYVE-type domain-containing protein n=1 Tax=Achlya hypogyna TaxID=1202772 RepID=A0A1V9Z2K6_ACHHY|nr:hypothetical protein ACHHYP_04118 [Achlya hypogyna]
MPSRPPLPPGEVWRQPRVQLSPDEAAEYIEKAKRTCHKTIMNALAMDNLPVDRVLSSAKTLRRAKIRKNQDLFEPHFDAVCGYTKIHISLAEVAAFFTLSTPEKLAAYSTVYDQAAVRRETLQTLVPRTPEHPRHYIGIEWMLLDRGTDMHSMCLLECHDEFEYVDEHDGSIRRGWVCSVHSVEPRGLIDPRLPPHQTPPRDVVNRSGHVFIETEEVGIMDYYCLAITLVANTSKSKNQKLMLNYVSRVLALEEYFLPLRLEQYFVDGGRVLLDLPPKRSVLFCAACDTKFSLFVQRKHCRLCGGVVCPDCSVKWITAPLYDRLEKIRLCIQCIECLGETPLATTPVVRSAPMASPMLKRAKSETPLLESRKEGSFVFHQDESVLQWSSTACRSSLLQDADALVSLAFLQDTLAPAVDDTPVTLEPGPEYDTMSSTLAITTQCGVASIGILDGAALGLLGSAGLDKQPRIDESLSLAALESAQLYICPDLLPTASPPFRFYAAMRLQLSSGKVVGLVELYDESARHGNVAGLVEQLQAVVKVLVRRLEAPPKPVGHKPPRRLSTGEVDACAVFGVCESPPNSRASSISEEPHVVDDDGVPLLAEAIHLGDAAAGLRSPPAPGPSLDVPALQAKLVELAASATKSRAMSVAIEANSTRIDSLLTKIARMEANLD